MNRNEKEKLLKCIKTCLQVGKDERQSKSTTGKLTQADIGRVDFKQYPHPLTLSLMLTHLDTSAADDFWKHLITKRRNFS